MRASMALNRQMRPNSGTAGHLSGSDRAARCPTGKVTAGGVTSRPAGDPGCQRLGTNRLVVSRPLLDQPKLISFLAYLVLVSA